MQHQHMLKDLKNSRTLPILQNERVVTFNLNDYCLCDLAVVTSQLPKIILPSPTPYLKESEVFHNIQGLNELTYEWTPTQLHMGSVMDMGSFAGECNYVFAAMI